MGVRDRWYHLDRQNQKVNTANSGWGADVSANVFVGVNVWWKKRTERENARVSSEWCV